MNSLDAQEILDVIDAKYFLISLKSREVIQSNVSDFELGEPCFKALFNRTEPCELEGRKCPCRSLTTDNGRISFVTEKIEGDKRKIYQVRSKLVKEDLAFIHLDDITEHVLFKEEVLQNSKRLESAEKLANFGYWELNTKTRMIYPSSGSKEIYGVDQSAISTHDVKQFVHEEDFELFNSNLTQLLDKGRPFDMSYRIIRPINNEIRYIRALAESGKGGHMAYGIILDITESVNAEKAMKEHGHYLESLFKNMNSAFAQFKVIYDHQNNPSDLIFIDVNARFEEYFHLKKGDLLNQSVRDVVPDSKQYLIDKYSGLALSGTSEVLFEYADGSGGYYEVSVFTPQKGFVAVILTDVTQRKRAEIALKEAKEKAIESDRLKTLFLANMSHEIRTPLNGILGFSNLLTDEHVGTEQRKLYGKIIENSGHRLVTVIDDILNISMIESNQLKIEYSDFNLSDMLEEILIFYEKHYKEKLEHIEFKLTQCEKGQNLVVYSDKDRIFQVLKNLLDNAFKFTSAGCIEFGTRNVDDENLELFVKDTGIGIKETKQNVIFQSFRQAEEGQERKYEGSGLGLAIVAGIVDKLKGEVVLESNPGEGAVFAVCIPHNRAKSKVISRLHHELSESITKAAKDKTIVSFEDDSLSVEFLKTVVESLGYTLVNFDYAEEGIEYLQTNPADMVFMDVQLPQMNGYEATRIIKSGHPKVPVVIQTAFAMREDKEKAYDAGCDDYIAKPLTVDTLKDKIDKFLNV